MSIKETAILSGQPEGKHLGGGSDIGGLGRASEQLSLNGVPEWSRECQRQRLYATSAAITGGQPSRSADGDGELATGLGRLGYETGQHA